MMVWKRKGWWHVGRFGYRTLTSIAVLVKGWSWMDRESFFVRAPTVLSARTEAGRRREAY